MHHDDTINPTPAIHLVKGNNKSEQKMRFVSCCE